MRYFLFALPVITLLFFGFRSADEVTPAVATGFAVVELFTSQGCSSCPSADVVLAELKARAKKTGESIHVLSFHVDYWNYLGWEDPYSSPYFSARQTDYTEQMGVRTYTPQLIINGTTQMIGSRRKQVFAAVDRALKGDAPADRLDFTHTLTDQKLTVNYTASGDLTGLNVTAFLVQPEGHNAVKRGENRGKELTHVSVVRGMETDKAASAGALTVEVPAGMDVAGAEVVLVLQEGKGRRIVECLIHP